MHTQFSSRSISETEAFSHGQGDLKSSHSLCYRSQLYPVRYGWRNCFRLLLLPCSMSKAATELWVSPNYAQIGRQILCLEQGMAELFHKVWCQKKSSKLKLASWCCHVGYSQISLLCVNEYHTRCIKIEQKWHLEQHDLVKWTITTSSEQKKKVPLMTPHQSYRMFNFSIFLWGYWDNFQ